jgi:hypothetical protein
MFMECPHCQKDNTQKVVGTEWGVKEIGGQQFCMYCGGDMQITTKDMCNHCHKALPPLSEYDRVRFCPYCGHEARQQPEPLEGVPLELYKLAQEWTERRDNTAVFCIEVLGLSTRAANALHRGGALSPVEVVALPIDKISAVVPRNLGDKGLAELNAKRRNWKPKEENT